MMNAVIASTSRILFGMAHHGQLPAFLMKVHPTWKTPWLAIVIVFLSIAIPQAILHDSQEMLILLLLSGTSLWLLGYMTAHLNVIILRRRYGGLHRPFRTPAYPLPQILGIAGMTYVLFRNAPSPDMRYRVYTITAFMVTIALVYGICWVRWHMKRPLFEKATIEQTLRD